MLLTSTKTDGGVTHADVLGDLDEGVGHLGGVGAAGDRGLGHGEDRWLLSTLDGLERSGAEAFTTQLSGCCSIDDGIVRGLMVITGEGTLGNLGLEALAKGRASGHLGHLRGDDTRSHCE